jgi:hypothetical protein
MRSYSAELSGFHAYGLTGLLADRNSERIETSPVKDRAQSTHILGRPVPAKTGKLDIF